MYVYDILKLSTYREFWQKNKPFEPDVNHQEFEKSEKADGKKEAIDIPWYLNPDLMYKKTKKSVRFFLSRFSFLS